MSRGKSLEAKPKGGGGRQYRVRIKMGEIAPVALLPGDPDRIPKITRLWTESKVTRHRGMWSTRAG